MTEITTKKMFAKMIAIQEDILDNQETILEETRKFANYFRNSINSNLPKTNKAIKRNQAGKIKIQALKDMFEFIKE